jgi:hypothetical protein
LLGDVALKAERARSPIPRRALWLYGWSFVDWRRQRREAVVHINLLAAETPAPAHA